MNTKLYRQIFLEIESDKWSDYEKLFAIHSVLGMETHNSITKANILKALEWLYKTDIELEIKEAIEKRLAEKPLVGYKVKQCPDCYAIVRDGKSSKTRDDFCPKCGKKLAWS